MVEQLNRIGVITCAVIVIFNSIGNIANQNSIQIWVLNVVLFLVIGLWLLFNKSRHVNGIIYLIIAIIFTLNSTEGNLSASIFFAYAAYLFGYHYAKLFVYICAVAVIIIQSVLAGFNVPVFAMVIVGYFSVIAPFVIFTAQPKTKITVVKNLNDAELLNMLVSGKNPKEIAYEKGVTSNAINKQLQRIRKEQNCETTFQLIGAWALSGKSGLNSDRTAQ